MVVGGRYGPNVRLPGSEGKEIGPRLNRQKVLLVLGLARRPFPAISAGDSG